MALRRTTLILFIVLVLAIVGAVVFYVMFPDRVRDALGGKKTNTNTTNSSVSNTNSSATPTNLSTPQDLEGATPLTSTIKVGTTDVTFASLDRLESFDQVAAPDGQQYVVLYFLGVQSGSVGQVFETFNQAQLVDGGKRYSIHTLKVASTVVKNDRGYVVFLVPDNAGKLTVEVGTGAEVQRVELP